MRLDAEEDVDPRPARRTPASPSPASLILVPSSTPAGMFTDSVRSLVTRPCPEQAPQGSEITRPRPWQVGQVRSTVKKPEDVRTAPWPLQVGQVLGLVPGLAPDPLHGSQETDVGTRI